MYLAPILGQPLVLLSVRENLFDLLLKHVHKILKFNHLKFIVKVCFYNKM